jgi:uncharacterized membrane protein YccF (DUF307 family)
VVPCWQAVKTIVNIVWLVLCGFWLAVGYMVAGVVMCILIITIPFGIAAFRLAAYALWPFGRTVVPKPDAGTGSFIGNVIWFLLAGLWMAIAPLGKDIVRTDDPRALYGEPVF